VDRRARMTSPFPGMDPYLEDPAYWMDFHATFVNYWREALADLLPDNYEATIEERIQLVTLSADETRVIRPDIGIAHFEAPRPGQSSAGTTAVLELEPVEVSQVFNEEFREAFIKIIHRPDQTLVTVLELLSPANKRDPDRGDYLSKRLALLHQQVHFVDLDLLVGGHRIPTADPLPRGDYFAFVTRSHRPTKCQVYAWTVRQPFPLVRIPLKAPDPDMELKLGDVFATAYEGGRYARRLNYEGPPPAPAKWAAEKAQGK